MVKIPDEGPGGIERRTKSGAGENEGESEDEGCSVGHGSLALSFAHSQLYTRAG